MSLMSASQARADWSHVLRSARAGEPVTVTQHGEPVAVVVDIVWWQNATVALGSAESSKGHVMLETNDHAHSRSWATAKAQIRAELSAELSADVSAQVLGEVRREIFGRPTLERIGAMAASGRTPDQVVNSALDHLARADRRQRLREESQSVLSDDSDRAEAAAVQADMGDLRAW